jgi:hypothetical protein
VEGEAGVVIAVSMEISNKKFQRLDGTPSIYKRLGRLLSRWGNTTAFLQASVCT